VWNRISVSPHAVEIKKILTIEMHNGKRHVMSRLVNCLSGLDDLVQIDIDARQQ
jgi:hypothetical protein